MSMDAIRAKGESAHTRRYNINSIGANNDANQTNSLVTHNGMQIKVEKLYSGKYDTGKGPKRSKA